MTTQTLTSARAKLRLRREEGDTLHERRSGPEKAGKKAAQAHISVMAQEALQLLDLKKGDLVVDATFGVGGHSDMILTTPGVRVLALDADQEAVAAGHERLEKYGARVALIEANFSELKKVLERGGATTVNKILFDLGWNRGQLVSGRGFSFLHDEPLSMSYGARPASGFTAAEILNTWEEKVLADVFFGYGEERFARPIAKAIVARREVQPFKTTFELVETIKDAVPGRYLHGKTHPATKTFQALRIAVNDELGVLKKGLAGAWEVLAPGGRIVVITFHSIEDRLVKRAFLGLAKDASARLLTEKPLVATRVEIISNPSARSAKMRGIEKPFIK